MKTTLSVIVVIVLSLGLAPAAFGQTTPEEQAAEHFERGVELYRDRSLDAALVEFERAYAIVPNFRLLYNLAQVQTERSQYVLALDLFERYLEEGGGEVPSDRREQVQEELTRLRKRVANLWVETNVAGATLFVDDVEVGKLPMKEHVLINAGMCRVRVEKQGYQPQTQTFTVAGGESPRLNLPLTEAVTRPPVSSASSGAVDATGRDSAPAARSNYTPFWISAAATGVLGGTTLAFGLLTRNANDDLDDELDKLPADPQRVDDARSEVRVFAALTDAFAVGTLIAGGFAIYFLADPPTEGSHLAKTGMKSLRIVPTGPGAVLAGQF